MPRTKVITAHRHKERKAGDGFGGLWRQPRRNGTALEGDEQGGGEQQRQTKIDRPIHQQRSNDGPGGHAVAEGEDHHDLENADAARRVTDHA
jgi:hypothetical protein